MKTQTLKSIFLICILHFALCHNSNAQIVYTDIPDTSFSWITPYINVDLNNDGQNDFKFIKGGVTGSCKNCGSSFPTGFPVSITPLNSNKVLDTTNTPRVLNYNDLIKGASLTWNDIAGQSMTRSNKYCAAGNCHFTYSGTWLNQLDKYIGVKLLVNGTKYYGWIRVSVTNSTFTIKDYAYDSTPNHSIHAGATSGARLAQNHKKYFNAESGERTFAKSGGNSNSRLTTIPAFVVEWQKTFGGSSVDFNDYMGNTIAKTADGGYVFTAMTFSNDIDVSGNHGDLDIWVVKINAMGNLQWQKCLGGTSDDWGQNIIVTNDGGILVGGSSSSDDGDISGNHGDYDIVLFKLDAAGNLQWQKTLGSSGYDDCASFIQNSSGNYMITGIVSENDGDVTGNHGGIDTWVVELNQSGNIQWQKCYGGSDDDGWYLFTSIIQSREGGYMLSTIVNSNDGQVTGHHETDTLGYAQNSEMFQDAWLVKLDNAGNIQWSKCYGGDNKDGFENIMQLSTGNYIANGLTTSQPGGDIEKNHGGFDWWIAKLTKTGNIIWSRNYGGSADEGLHNRIFELPNGELIAPSGLRSNDGDCHGLVGPPDLWIAKMDADGNIVSDYVAGTIGYENLSAAIIEPDGSLIVAAMKDSTSIDSYDHDTNADVWILKLNPSSISNNEAQLYNSANGITDDICTNANSVKLNLRITIPPGFVSMQGVTVKWYKNNNLISVQNAAGAGYTGVYGKTIYKNLTVPKLFGFGDGTYKAKISYSHKTNLFSAYHQENIWSNNINIDFNNNCGVKLADENSLNENKNDLSLKVFPNPLSNSSTVTFSLSESQKVSLKIFDVNGTLVSTLADKIFEQGEHQIEFNAEKINAGIYFLKIQSGEFLKTEKLIITK